MPQFTREEVHQLAEYVQMRRLMSSMGDVFYVEFPPDTEQIHDGKKRPPKNSDLVYNFSTDSEGNVHARSALHHFTCTSAGDVRAEEAQQALAQQLFAYLMQMAK